MEEIYKLLTANNNNNGHEDPNAAHALISLCMDRAEVTGPFLALEAARLGAFALALKMEPAVPGGDEQLRQAFQRRDRAREHTANTLLFSLVMPFIPLCFPICRMLASNRQIVSNTYRNLSKLSRLLYKIFHLIE